MSFTRVILFPRTQHAFFVPSTHLFPTPTTHVFCSHHAPCFRPHVSPTPTPTLTLTANVPPCAPRHPTFFLSKLTRQSIDALKQYFKDDVSKEDWGLVVKLKKVLSLPPPLGLYIPPFSPVVTLKQVTNIP